VKSYSEVSAKVFHTGDECWKNNKNVITEVYFNSDRVRHGTFLAAEVIVSRYICIKSDVNERKMEPGKVRTGF
jgi:hypothetical protein